MTSSTLRPTPKAGIREIGAYVGGKAAVEGVANPVKLSSNENPLGCSEAAREAFLKTAGQLHVYPDGRVGPLRAAIAETFGLEPDRLVFGCGSDEIFAILNQVYLAPGDNMVQGRYGFSAWAISARACQAEVRMAPEPDYTVSVDELLKLVDERTRIVYLANPANPTGTWIPGSEARRLYDALPRNVILVLDGAYAEFGTHPSYDGGLDFARDKPNVVVTRTFSKLHGLAGLRVGWAYVPAEVAVDLERIRPPFNINVPAVTTAIAALRDEDFQKRSIEHVERWRPWLAQQLGGVGLEVSPSSANFVLVHFPKTPGKTAQEAEAYLGKNGYIVRGVGGYGLPDSLRITIGLEEDNRAVADLLGRFMAA